MVEFKFASSSLVLLLLLLLLSRDCLCDIHHHNVDEDSTHAEVHGNVMLGGLVAVHDAGGQNNVHCRSNISSNGIQRVEAMRYAVAKVNEEWEGSGLKLGINIRDSCGSETKALDESLQFVVDRVPVCKNNDTVPIFGVVGASMSLLTAAVANLLRLFQIPLISYAATSTELGDVNKYDYLLRTVPPDSFQSRAMIDFIVDKLEWKSVFIIYSLGSYGEYGYESFVKAVQKSNVNKSLCIVAAEKVRPGISQKEMNRILNYFKSEYPNVTGIVCYCEIPDVKTLLQSIASFGPKGRFTLIGSDSTLSGTKSKNSIIFSLHYNYTRVADFYENWYKKLTPKHFQGANKTLNPWFQTFWNDSCWHYKRENPAINCTNDDVFGLCRTTPVDTTLLTCRKDDKIPYTIDAVHAFAHAIRNLWMYKFKNKTSELLKEDLKNFTFLEKYLRKVEFEGRSGRVHFNTSVVRGSYDINRYNEEKQKFEVIGRWDNGHLSLNPPGYQLLLQQDFGGSTCQELCGPGERKVLQSKRCCWTCDPCKGDQYLSNNTCVRCNVSQRPIEPELNGCQDLEIRHFHIAGKIVIALMSTFGVTLTLCIIKTFIANNDSPLVKASGREMTYIQLIGILLLFCMPVVFIPKPTETLCGVARISFGTLICLCYGSLLVKTNRIARIFTGRQDLSFLTPNWQVCFTVLIMVPQILISVIGIMLEPDSRTVKYERRLDYGVEMCKPYAKDTIATIAYNLLLVFLCTFYAFRTRKAPANFNEARYIGFVMYTTCVIWCAFLPVYFGTDLEYNTVFMLVMMVAMTLLVGLFGMKMYILVYRPDKNSMQSSKPRSITITRSQESFVEERYNQLPSPRMVRFKKFVTDSPLASDGYHGYQQDSFEMKESESSFTSKTTLKLDRGTSTTDDSGISESSDEVFHEPLHKTMTM